MCECSIAFSSTFINFAFILETSLYKLDFSILIRLEIESSFVEVIFRHIQEAISDRSSFLPLPPVILIHI
jgi:hypothetical protein